MPASLPTPNREAFGTPTDAANQLIAMYGQGEFTLTFPVSFALADAAVLYTVPTGLRLLIQRPFWEVTTSWTGGTSSAIGLSSSNASYSTKGDLLGGASGDVAAGLVSTGSPFKGTIGAKIASQGVVVLVAGDTIRFDRITSAFTAGVGNVQLGVRIIPAS